MIGSRTEHHTQTEHHTMSTARKPRTATYRDPMYSTIGESRLGYDYNRATVDPERLQRNAINRSGEKETIDTIVALAVDSTGRVHEAARVVLYMARSGDGASPVYCAAWFHSPASGWGEASGKGAAGGYGYCKRSSAIVDAIRSAGIKLAAPNIGGAGIPAAKVAIGAACRAMGWRSSLHFVET